MLIEEDSPRQVNTSVMEQDKAAEETRTKATGDSEEEEHEMISSGDHNEFQVSTETKVVEENNDKMIEGEGNNTDHGIEPVEAEKESEEPGCEMVSKPFEPLIETSSMNVEKEPDATKTYLSNLLAAGVSRGRDKELSLLPATESSSSEHNQGVTKRTQDMELYVPDSTILASGSCRARRAAASRAMQGWHTQLLSGNGEVNDPANKDKNIVLHQKREKQTGTTIVSSGLLKCKRPLSTDNGDGAKTVIQVSKTMLDVTVADVGPPDDWAKINVHRKQNCFEVYPLVPRLISKEVRVQSIPAERLLISGESENPKNPWGATLFKKVVSSISSGITNKKVMTMLGISLASLNGAEAAQSTGGGDHAWQCSSLLVAFLVLMGLNYRFLDNETPPSISGDITTIDYQAIGRTHTVFDCPIEEDSKIIYDKLGAIFRSELDGCVGECQTWVKSVRFSPESFNEVQLLSSPLTSHPNILRLHRSAEENGNCYSLVDKWDCTLNELIDFWRDSESPQHAWQYIVKNHKAQTLHGRPSAFLIEIFKDIVSGVAHMHRLDIIHRDLTPEIIVITINKNGFQAKIGDFSIAKGDGREALTDTRAWCSERWRAAEQVTNKKETVAADIFNLGCMLYYILTDGKNPYIHRGYNVVDVSDVIEFPEAYKLISQMTKNNPSSRPTVQDVLAHPLFWSDEDKLMFLQDVNEACKSVAKDYTDLDSTLHKLVESAGWKRIVDQNHYASSTAGYNNYYSGLLNFVRNTLCHFPQFSLNVQHLFQADGLYEYFFKNFPWMLIETYDFIQVHPALNQEVKKIVEIIRRRVESRRRV